MSSDKDNNGKKRSDKYEEKVSFDGTFEDMVNMSFNKPKEIKMNKANFEALNLKNGDRIWVMDENGSGHWGNYVGNYDSSNQTFEFQNSGSGESETVSIEKCQQIQRG